MVPITHCKLVHEMKIINETKWRTEDLKAIAMRILPDEIESVTKRKKIVIIFRSTKGNAHRGSSGYAYRIGGEKCCVRLASTKYGEGFVDKIDLCVVIAHELAHLRGLPGGRASEYQMRRSPRYGRNPKNAEIYSWVNDMPLRPQESPKSVKVDPAVKAESEIAHFEKLIAGWQAKAKRAANAIKKYQKKIKYRQSKLTAAAKGVVKAVREKREVYGPSFDHVAIKVEDGGIGVPDNDGWYWVYYRPGWQSGINPGSHCDHEHGKRSILNAVRMAEPCDCDGCRADIQDELSE